MRPTRGRATHVLTISSGENRFGIRPLTARRGAGSGDVLLQDLVAHDVAATISGFGGAEVLATSSLDAVVSGTGVIDYTGAPSTVSKKISGTGAITRTDGP